MKHIVFTGGGTAGHVTPNIALFPAVKEAGYGISYIGSYEGIEKELITGQGVSYYGIASGKFRRYFSWKNFTDPFNVVKGYFQAKKLLKKLNPNIVFSKGGFVSVPVVMAAKKCKIPCIIHESDITPGLANKLALPSSTKVCANFPETLNYLPKEKAVLTGSPIRKELFSGNKIKGLDFCGFTANKPVLLVIGGSTGAASVNNAIRDLLPTLLQQFQIIHLCGKGKTDETFNGREGYVQFEYINKELKDLFAAADVIVSRAGANAICELLALKKPNILIPLSAAASRGDQILNAESFERQGFSYVLKEEDVTNETLLAAVNEVYANRDKYVTAMNESKLNSAIETITEMIKTLSK